MTTSTEEH